MIRLSEDKKRLVFETGNYIDSEVGAKMVEYLNKITQLNKIELQKLYKKELLASIEKENQKGNAGIGLLEILKISNHTMDYKLEDINQALKFICLSTDIEY